MYIIDEHLTHYKKIKLNKDISIRFFYTFQDKPNLETIRDKLKMQLENVETLIREQE